MPVLYEDDIDRSDLTIGIAKALFEDYDFNPGQQSIIDSADYNANVNQTVTYDVQGDIWEITSEISVYRFEINVSHPEAVDESLYKVLEDTKSYVYELFEKVDYVPRGQLSEETISGNINFYSTLIEIGLFK
jgi:hypothetical protein